jgi:c-di-GMP-binding flagellar brake protein YcgR
MSTEHRELQRFSALFEVTFGKIKVPSTNISTGGMQLICDRITVSMLKRQIKDDIVDITIPIPKQESIVITCRIAYISAYDDNESLIGIEFESFEGDGQSVLETYIKDNAGGSLKPIE